MCSCRKRIINWRSARKEKRELQNANDDLLEDVDEKTTDLSEAKRQLDLAKTHFDHYQKQTEKILPNQQLFSAELAELDETVTALKLIVKEDSKKSQLRMTGLKL